MYVLIDAVRLLNWTKRYFGVQKRAWALTHLHMWFPYDAGYYNTEIEVSFRDKRCKRIKFSLLADSPTKMLTFVGDEVFNATE